LFTKSTLTRIGRIGCRPTFPPAPQRLRTMVRSTTPVSPAVVHDARDLAITEFRGRFGRDCAAVARAPGRVNLLGEHVDYNDGYVLPAAIDRATYVAFAPAQSQRTTIWAADFGESATFDTQTINDRMGIDGRPLPSWARYPAGVAWALEGAGRRVAALDAVVASEVPRGAGLSSSASVELAFGVAWQLAGSWSMPPMQLALVCQRAENRYVGVNCGIMDQATSACGEDGRLLFLDCRSLKYRTVALPHAVVVVIADSGVKHALTASGYNDRRAACEEAVRLLGMHLPGIKALRDVDPREFNRFSTGLPREVENRARHVVEEIQRTRLAPHLLERGDMHAFGALMNASHASLRDLYEVSCAELDALVEIAQSLEGCYGARLTGAGFGGCTVNLVEAASVQDFVHDLGAKYEAKAQHHAEIYVCSPSAGASATALGSS
jgi:galactokinase